jgi:hypothetical protein
VKSDPHAGFATRYLLRLNNLPAAVSTRCSQGVLEPGVYAVQKQAEEAHGFERHSEEGSVTI